MLYENLVSFSCGWRWNSLSIPNHCQTFAPPLSNDTSHTHRTQSVKWNLQLKWNWLLICAPFLFLLQMPLVEFRIKTLKFNTLPTFSPVMVNLWAKLFPNIITTINTSHIFTTNFYILTRTESWAAQAKQSAIVKAPWSQTTTMTHYQWFEIDFSVQSHKSYRTRPCINVYS